MPLIRSHRLTPTDVKIWEETVLQDAALAKGRRIMALESRAMLAIEDFLRGGPAYVSVSWGKDSVAVADLALRVDPSLPLVYAREDPYHSPEYAAVRDAFMANREAKPQYHETSLHADVDLSRECGWAWDPKVMGSFDAEAKEFGARHICGIRAEESRDRTVRMRVYGTSSKNSCAPIGWWKLADVFAYLHARNLPIHPAYAMTMGGRIERSAIRVAPLTGPRGTGRGRAEWERHYYRDVIHRLRAEAERV